MAEVAEVAEVEGASGSELEATLIHDPMSSDLRLRLAFLGKLDLLPLPLPLPFPTPSESLSISPNCHIIPILLYMLIPELCLSLHITPPRKELEASPISPCL